MMDKIVYKNYVIVKAQGNWYEWYNTDYSGPGDARCGFSATITEAKRAIDEQIEELEDDAC